MQVRVYLVCKMMSELIWTAVILLVAEQKNMSMLTVLSVLRASGLLYVKCSSVDLS